MKAPKLLLRIKGSNLFFAFRMIDHIVLVMIVSIKKMRRPSGLLALVVAFLALCLFPHRLTAQGISKPQAHADRGMRLAESGDLKGAEAELRLAVELAPNDPRLLADLGGILVMQHRLEEASACFEKSLRLDPANRVVRRSLAANQWQLGDLQAAQRNLELLLKRSPGDKSAILLLGMVAENRKDYRRAAKLLESVPELVVERPESVVALARSYYTIQQREKARETLKSLLGHPADSNGVFLGGQVAAEANDYETAEKLFDSIWTIYPDKATLGHNLAQAQYHAKRFSKSQSTLLGLIDKGYESSDIYNLLGWCYLKLDQKREAVRAFDQAIDLEPSKESNYLDLGLILANANLFPVALAVANKALGYLPNSYRVYMLKGLIETRQGQYSHAVKSYTRALELKPEAEANRGLAKAQLKAGWDEQARATYENGIKRFPRDALHYQEYALMLLKAAETGDTAAEARSLVLFKKAIEMDNSLSESHYQLGNRALAQGRMKEAIEHLTLAARLDPQSAKAHYALARAYRRLGRQEEALKELQIHGKLKAEEEKSSRGLAATEAPE